MQASQYITSRPLVKIAANMKQMLKDRGYRLRRTPSDPDLLVSHILKCVEAGEPVLVGHRGEAHVIAFFTEVSNLSISQYRQMLDYALEHYPDPDAPTTVLVLTKDGLTHATRAAMFGDHGHISFESWTYSELSLNITKHALFPKHQALSPRSTRALLARYGTTPDRLYQMNPTDPARKYYGWPSGTVVQVERRLGQLPPSLVYRHVK